MSPPVPTLLDLSDLPLPPPFADGLFSFFAFACYIRYRVSQCSHRSVEGGAEEWQRLLDQEWQEYQQSDHRFEFELTLADFEEMAEPDFSDDDFDLELNDEIEPSAQTEIIYNGALLDVYNGPIANPPFEVLPVPPSNSPLPRSDA